MKVINLLPVRSNRYQYGLLVLAIGLAVIYLSSVYRTGDTAHFTMSILFLLSVGILLWEKRHGLRFKSSILSSLIGILLISIMLWQRIASSHDPITDAAIDPGLRSFPFICAFSISLIASGFKGLKQYQHELIILFFLGIPSVLVPFLFNLSPITAKFSAFLLWYTGFNVSIDDIYINLPTGGVRVFNGCSGAESVTYLLGLSVISLIMFPLERSSKIFIPIFAMLIGFIVNGVRVAIMTILSASQNKAAFDYWHEGSGSLVFGMISVLIFGLLYLFLLKREKPKKQEY